MNSVSKTLQTLKEMQKIDQHTPGPETFKWIKRVRLMKTLMLDCRDQEHNPRNRHVNEEGDGTLTDRTKGGVE
jgi:hypothetical protein